ncbi:MAG: sugar ABC transporter substrate-binding protein [Anaerolineae bacterium]|nr:sugar ABC transporter substrate-binding protein [Anaerolineae bacterium]
MLRKYALLLVGLMMLIMLAPVAAQENTVVRYFNFTAGSDHVEDLNTIIAAFEEANPGITVEIDSAPFGDYFTLLQTDVISGEAPDVFELNFENFESFAANETLMDLSAVAGEAPYYPRALEAFQYDGKQYALPESFSTVLLYYNADLFDQAGLEYPTAEWTWEDAQEAALAIRALGDDIWGLYTPIQFWEFYKKAAQQGDCQFFNEDETESLINSEGCVAALQSMVNFVDDGVIPSQADLSGISDSELFANGKLGMWVTGTWMFSALGAAEFPWNVQIEPMINQHASHFFSNAVAVSATTDVAEAATKLALFLTSSETAAQVRVDHNWELPALDAPELFESFLAASPPENRAAVFQALESAVVPPTIERQAEMTDTLNAYITQVVDGELTAQEALDQAKVELDALLD